MNEYSIGRVLASGLLACIALVMMAKALETQAQFLEHKNEFSVKIINEGCQIAGRFESELIYRCGENVYKTASMLNAEIRMASSHTHQEHLASNP